MVRQKYFCSFDFVKLFDVKVKKYNCIIFDKNITEMKNIFYVLFLITFIFSSCTKQEGCTDSLALNYNIDAENDDGSCEFGLVGGSWTTQSISTNGTMTVSFGGIPLLDSTINYTEINPDSLEPYRLTMNDDNTYIEYDVMNAIVESGTWAVLSDQLTINTPDTTLVLTIGSVGKSNLSLSLNLAESSNDMGATIDYDITQVINSTR